MNIKYLVKPLAILAMGLSANISYAGAITGITAPTSAAVDTPVSVTITGSGTCDGGYTIYWGDTSNTAVGGPITLPHRPPSKTYRGTGWKTISVDAGTGCSGGPTKRINITARVSRPGKTLIRGVDTDKLKPRRRFTPGLTKRQRIGVNGPLIVMCAALRATIVGTPGNDVIMGTPGNDVIHGLGGNDTINGGGGNDVICGGSGNDTLIGGLGNDKLYGGQGSNRIEGGPGDDLLTGGSGRDTIIGGAGIDSMHGGDGNDVLNGGAGNDTITGGNGNDTIQGGSGNDQIVGGPGNDILNGGSGNDNIQGRSGNDLVQGGSGNDTVLGQQGDDRVYGGSGNDQLYGGTGNDRCYGGSGTDVAPEATLSSSRTRLCNYRHSIP